MADKANNENDVMSGHPNEEPASTPAAGAQPAAQPAAELVTIIMDGNAYQVAPEIALQYQREINRRETALRSEIKSLKDDLAGDDNEPEDDLPKINHALMHTDPDEYTRQVQRHAEAVADRKAAQVEAEAEERRQIEATKQAKIQQWEDTINLFFDKYPEFDKPNVEDVVGTVWRKNARMFSQMDVEPGLAMLAQKTREFLTGLGEETGRAPNLVTSRRRSAPAAKAKDTTDEEPRATLGDYIRQKRAAFMGGNAKAAQT